MKIGILTFHRVLNYGAALQLYALTEVLKLRGNDVFVLDYRKEFLDRSYTYFPIKVLFERKNVFITFRRFFNQILTIPILRKKKRSFRNFADTYFQLDARPFSRDQDIPQDYNVYIVGSDQVWNVTLTRGFDANYFLSHAPKYSTKISYAASLESNNHDFINNNRSLYAKALSCLDYISVREQKTKEILQDVSEAEIEQVLDPTLLLSRQDYDKISVEPKDKNYVLVYHLSKNKDLLLSARKIAQERDLNVIEIHAGLKPFLLNTERHKQDLAPNQFLGYFKNADFVITSSFHGTCFSLIYEKPFYVISKIASERQRGLLENLDLVHRMIKSDHYVDFDDRIDFERANRKLKELKDQSMAFLDRALGS